MALSRMFRNIYLKRIAGRLSLLPEAFSTSCNIVKFPVVPHQQIALVSDVPKLFLCQRRLLQTDEQSRAGLSKKISDETLLDEEYKTVVEFLNKRVENLSTAEVSSWFNQVLDYNVPHGKKIRGLGVIKTYKYLKSNPSEEERRLAAILGWCVEMVQAFFLITDDVMDQSSTRRGLACWYRKKEVGLVAINDAILVENSVFQVLKAFLGHHPNYYHIVDVFHEVIFYTSSGQCLDMLSTTPNAKVELDKYTEKRFSEIVKLKTSYYTCCLPVRLALLLAKQGDSYTKEVESVLLTVGHFFQVQDDFLDGFGDPSVTGKKGTDIEDGKCSWPVVMALERVNLDDRRILQENYGSSDPECVEKVMGIFRKVDIPSLYEKYETETYNSLCKKIESLRNTSKIPSEVFYGLLNKVYKRLK